MKQLLLLVILSTIPLLSFGQCNVLIERAEQDIQTRLYQEAINKLLLLQKECPAKRDQISRLIQKTFRLIKEERDRATHAEELANEEKRKAENERQRADSLALTAFDEKRKADSAFQEASLNLEIANQILSQLYFYQDKFGLSLKNIAPRSDTSIYRYGFINKAGEEVIPFQFEESTPFLNDGYARVKQSGVEEELLLDTAGVVYLRPSKSISPYLQIPGALISLGSIGFGVKSYLDARRDYKIYEENRFPNSTVYNGRSRKEWYDDANKEYKLSQGLVFGGLVLLVASLSNRIKPFKSFYKEKGTLIKVDGYSMNLSPDILLPSSNTPTNSSNAYALSLSVSF